MKDFKDGDPSVVPEKPMEENKPKGGLDDLLATMRAEVGEHEVAEKEKLSTEKTSGEKKLKSTEAVERLKAIDGKTAELSREEEIFAGKAFYYAVADKPKDYEGSLKRGAAVSTEKNNSIAESVILGERSGVKQASWNEIRQREGIEGIEKNAIRIRDDNNKQNLRILNETTDETFGQWSKDLKGYIAAGQKTYATEGWAANEKPAKTPEELARNLQKTFVEYFDRQHIDGGHEARFDDKGMIPAWHRFLEQGYGIALAALESGDPKTGAISLAFTEGIRTMPDRIVERFKTAIGELEPGNKAEFLKVLDQEKKKQVDYKSDLTKANKHFTTISGESEDWWVK